MKITIKQLKSQCKYWGITMPSKGEIDLARIQKRMIPIQILGVYNPSTRELYPWSISDDRG